MIETMFTWIFVGLFLAFAFGPTIALHIALPIYCGIKIADYFIDRR